MTVNNIIKRIQNIMRQDAGINGDAQRIEQMTWMFFLKVYDAQEETWEWKDGNYKSIIPEDLRWRKWAVDKKDGEALTGDALLSFVNEKLFPALKNLPVNADTPRAKSIVQETFADLNQYMKNGTLLRQVVNIVNEIEFDDADDRHTFGDIYEGFMPITSTLSLSLKSVIFVPSESQFAMLGASISWSNRFVILKR